MPKITLFLLKNRKTRPALGVFRSPVSPKPGGYAPDPHISSISLRIPRCTFNYNRRFHVA